MSDAGHEILKNCTFMLLLMHSIVILALIVFMVFTIQLKPTALSLSDKVEYHLHSRVCLAYRHNS